MSDITAIDQVMLVCFHCNIRQHLVKRALVDAFNSTIEEFCSGSKLGDIEVDPINR